MVYCDSLIFACIFDYYVFFKNLTCKSTLVELIFNPIQDGPYSGSLMVGEASSSHQ